MTKHKVKEQEKESTVKVFLEVEKQFNIMKINNELFIAKGNKQASRRARVASVQVSNLLKEYRHATLTAIAAKASA